MGPVSPLLVSDVCVGPLRPRIHAHLPLVLASDLHASRTLPATLRPATACAPGPKPPLPSTGQRSVPLFDGLVQTFLPPSPEPAVGCPLATCHGITHSAESGMVRGL
ncbi:hypothetical protein GQ53DRAFT_438523 [Thozetella sp. PMI_491]|nr:hypothetical protein GQ53DRAFT_438523 [Thozetella sp. PMI_491]